MTTRRIFLLAMVTYFILITILFLVMPQLVRAADTSVDNSCKIGSSKEEKEAAIRVAIPLPGVTQKVTISNTESYNAVKNLSCYLSGFYRYFAGVAGILATVMIMYGGIQYVISFGNSGRLQAAKDTIFSAMVGLVITLGSYIILFTINPNLVTLKLPEVGKIYTINIDTDWCLSSAGDMPVVPGSTGCGDKGLHTENGTQTECIWQGDCGQSGQICFYGLGGYKCRDPKDTCKSSYSDLCQQVSRAIYAAGLTSGACASKPPDSQECAWEEQLRCPDNWVRVDCTFHGIGDLISTPCTEVLDSVKYYSLGGGMFPTFCFDFSERPVAAANIESICCAEQRDIDCRWPKGRGPLFGNEINSNEVQVDCAQYPPQQYPNACTQDEIRQGMICAMQLEQRNRN